VNLLTRRVECGGKEIHLTKKELELLEIFMRHPDQVFSAYVIIQKLWNREFDGDTNVVERHYEPFAGQIGSQSSSHRIETVRGWVIEWPPKTAPFLNPPASRQPTVSFASAKYPHPVSQS